MVNKTYSVIRQAVLLRRVRSQHSRLHNLTTGGGTPNCLGGKPFSFLYFPSSFPLPTTARVFFLEGLPPPTPHSQLITTENMSNGTWTAFLSWAILASLVRRASSATLSVTSHRLTLMTLVSSLLLVPSLEIRSPTVYQMERGTPTRRV